jgi:hypothetical protein
LLGSNVHKVDEMKDWLYQVVKKYFIKERGGGNKDGHDWDGTRINAERKDGGGF